MKTFFISSFVLFVFCTSCKKETVLSAQANIQNITESSALVKFSGSLANAKNITEWGVAYGTEPYPQYWGNSFNFESGATEYSSEQVIQNLKDSTNYNLRVYVKDDNGVFYSDQVFSFTTAAMPPIPNQVGDTGPAGGFVFYSDGQGGGLEMLNISIQNSWGCQSPSLPGCVSSLGAGAANTQLILNACPSNNSAPAYCDQFSYGGYDDWYLPSFSEMLAIYQNLHTMGIITLNSGLYISSTQSSVSSAYCFAVNGTTGGSYNALKTTDYYFLPVRTIIP